MSASSRHDGEPSVERRETNRPEHTSHEPRRPLNVLRIASDLYPDVTGGGAIHAHAMSKQQAKHGHSVTVLTSDHGNSNRPTVETVDGYTVVRHREIASPFGNSITPGILGSFREYLSDADVVHAHSHLYFTSNLAAALRRVSDTPLVVTNHGLLSQTAPKWIQRLFIPTVARFTFNTADRILCYTDTDRQRLRSRNISSSIAVINNGIDCEQFAPPRQISSLNGSCSSDGSPMRKGCRCFCQRSSGWLTGIPISNCESSVMGHNGRRTKPAVRNSASGTA